METSKQFQEWVEVPGFNGRYFVSRSGEVKSVYGKKERIRKSSYGDNGYVNIHLNGGDNGRVYFKVHRLVMLCFYGSSDLHVDHINGIKDDNRLENLRYCTVRENQSFDNKRMKKPKYSKYIGVTKDVRRNKWVSKIVIDGKTVHIGTFDNELDAANAYQNKLKTITHE
jgi:hypothetical protein